MDEMSVLAVGNYANLFPITFDKDFFLLMRTLRSSFADFQALRDRVQPCRVYATDEYIYGFGDDLSKLEDLRFEKAQVKLDEVAPLTTTVIKEGLTRSLVRAGYELDPKIRARAYSRAKPISTLMDAVKLFEGFEFRPIYLRDKSDGTLFFSVIIDLRFKLELLAMPTSYGEVRRFAIKEKGEDVAIQVIRDIRVKTGDYSPSGNRNPEASRFRLNHILDFVREFKDIMFYDGSHATISGEPVRIAEGGLSR